VACDSDFLLHAAAVLESNVMPGADGLIELPVGGSSRFSCLILVATDGRCAASSLVPLKSLAVPTRDVRQKAQLSINKFCSFVRSVRSCNQGDVIELGDSQK